MPNLCEKFHYNSNFSFSPYLVDALLTSSHFAQQGQFCVGIQGSFFIFLSSLFPFLKILRQNLLEMAQMNCNSFGIALFTFLCSILLLLINTNTNTAVGQVLADSKPIEFADTNGIVWVC